MSYLCGPSAVSVTSWGRNVWEHSWEEVSVFCVLFSLFHFHLLIVFAAAVTQFEAFSLACVVICSLKKPIVTYFFLISFISISLSVRFCCRFFCYGETMFLAAASTSSSLTRDSCLKNIVSWLATTSKFLFLQLVLWLVPCQGVVARCRRVMALLKNFVHMEVK